MGIRRNLQIFSAEIYLPGQELDELSELVKICNTCVRVKQTERHGKLFWKSKTTLAISILCLHLHQWMHLYFEFKSRKLIIIQVFLFNSHTHTLHKWVSFFITMFPQFFCLTSFLSLSLIQFSCTSYTFSVGLSCCWFPSSIPFPYFNMLALPHSI